MTAPQLLDAEKLLARLTDLLRPAVNANSALVGIYTGGVLIAERLHAALSLTVPLGTLDVSFYRDDYDVIGLHTQPRPSEIPFEVEGRDIILVDDVLYTGRTIRAAMNEIFDYGRPASMRLAALVDRGGRELPIAAEFVGTSMMLPADELLVLKKDASDRLQLSVQPRKRQA
ncbi:MAG: bifunctional pyr operon transcriptional regulator/uracil phosphoribosyltransferase PyrR [Pseudomonadota bacterium]